MLLFYLGLRRSFSSRFFRDGCLVLKVVRLLQLPCGKLVVEVKKEVVSEGVQQVEKSRAKILLLYQV